MAEPRTEPTKEQIEKLLKLFAMALHPTTCDGEVDNASRAIIKHMRLNGISLQDLAVWTIPIELLVPPATDESPFSSATSYAEPKPEAEAATPPRPPPIKDWQPAENIFDTVMPWGKYQGKTLGWIAESAESYLNWLVTKATFTGKWERLKDDVIGVWNATTESNRAA